MSSQSCPQCTKPVGPRDRFCKECGAPLTARQRDRVEIDIGVAAGVSDRGRRHFRNEDALALRGLHLDTGQGPAQHSTAVAVVCDGVSSAPRPDEASEIAAQVAAEALIAALTADNGPVAATREAICAAGKAVTELAKLDCADSSRADSSGVPACTVVSAVVTGRAVTVGWIGDSRAYWIPQVRTETAPPSKLTEDDSWLAQVLAAGTLTPAQAATDRRAHAITAWLGEDATAPHPHVVTLEFDGPGVVVVCTDGLWNYLDDVEELAAALPADALDAPLEAARRLVEIALHCGGRDNITVAVLGVGHSSPLARRADLG